LDAVSTFHGGGRCGLDLFRARNVGEPGRRTRTGDRRNHAVAHRV
jgi:hypothetical protein